MMKINPYTGEPLPDNQYIPVDPVKEKTDIDPRKKVKNFYMDYISSDVYSKRLKNMEYENPMMEKAYRLDNIIKTSVLGQQKSPGLIEQLKNKITGKVYSTVGSKFDNNTRKIILDKEQIDNLKKEYSNLSENEVLAHEYGHAINYSKNMNNRLNEKEFNELDSRLKSTTKDTHSKSAEENYSDIQAYRYILKEQGIYDTTKDNFSKEHIKKSDHTFIKERLLKNYSEEDLIWLMNNIASNDSKNNYYTNQKMA